eukprot:m.37006 g.37006  ORF g.37006 m.37006 type:complete len:348 (-) comp6712_c0_seq2:1774-2817(-)
MTPFHFRHNCKTRAKAIACIAVLLMAVLLVFLYGGIATRRLSFGTEDRDANAKPEKNIDTNLHSISIGVALSFHAGKQREKARTWIERELLAGHPCQKLQKNVTLFIINENLKELEKTRERFIPLLSRAKVANCFPDVVFAHTSLKKEEDSYPKGASLHALRALHLIHAKTNVAFTFVVEPDVISIQNYWVDRLRYVIETHNELIGDEEGLWMLGSYPRGLLPSKQAIAQLLHLNGNAIYNTGSHIFDSFLSLVQANIIHVTSPDKKILSALQTSPPGNAFEVDIATMFLHPMFNAFLIQHAHRYIASSFIQNKWRSKWSESNLLKDSPKTYLVHGGAQLKRDFLYA